MRIWVGIYIRLGIWRRGYVWGVVQVRRHLGFVMALRAGMGKGQRLLWAAFSGWTSELMWQEEQKIMGVESDRIERSSARVTKNDENR